MDVENVNGGYITSFLLDFERMDEHGMDLGKLLFSVYYASCHIDLHFKSHTTRLTSYDTYFSLTADFISQNLG